MSYVIISNNIIFIVWWPIVRVGGISHIVCWCTEISAAYKHSFTLLCQIALGISHKSLKCSFINCNLHKRFGGTMNVGCWYHPTFIVPPNRPNLLTALDPVAQQLVPMPIHTLWNITMFDELLSKFLSCKCDEGSCVPTAAVGVGWCSRHRINER